MKRYLSLWLGLAAAAGMMALILAPANAQKTNTAKMGKIHGSIINPTGQPQGGGTVSLSTDGGVTSDYTFPVDAEGNYSGEATSGTYTLVYRAANTPKDKKVDSIRGVKIVAGQDLEQNDDMSRPEYISTLSGEERKQLEELKKVNAAALKENAVIAQLNADLKAVDQDRRDIDNANATAVQALGATASKTAIEDKENEIKTAKYTDIESLMTKDTGIKPSESLLWVNLAFGQAGLKNYDAAMASYKKTIDLETAAPKPRLPVIAQAEAGLGEVYARTGKIAEAKAAFDAAAKDDPQSAPLNLRNEAIIFYQLYLRNGDSQDAEAEAAAADEAIKFSPNDPLLYYLKGNGLVPNATVDPKTNMIVLPPGCADAYRKYLELDPDGQFAGDVTNILQSAGEKVASSSKAPKSK